MVGGSSARLWGRDKELESSRWRVLCSTNFFCSTMFSYISTFPFLKDILPPYPGSCNLKGHFGCHLKRVFYCMLGMLWSLPGIQHAPGLQSIPLHKSGISLLPVKEKVIIKLHLHILCTKGTSAANGVKSLGKRWSCWITGVQSKQVNLFIFCFAGSTFTQC